MEKLAQNSHTEHKFSLKTKNSLVVHISRARTPDRTETIGVVKTRGVAVFGKNEKISLTMMMMRSARSSLAAVAFCSILSSDDDRSHYCLTAAAENTNTHTFTLLARRPVSIRVSHISEKTDSSRDSAITSTSVSDFFP